MVPEQSITVESCALDEFARRSVQVGRASTWMSSKTHLVPSSNMACSPGRRRQVLDTGRISRLGAFRACVLVCETGVELVMGSKSGDRVRAQGVPRALLSLLSSHWRRIHTSGSRVLLLLGVGSSYLNGLRKTTGRSTPRRCRAGRSLFVGKPM